MMRNKLINALLGLLVLCVAFDAADGFVGTRRVLLAAGGALGIGQAVSGATPLGCTLYVGAGSSLACAPGAQLNVSALSIMGDSRAAFLTISSGYNLTAQQWLNAANARAGQRYLIGTNAGGSGCRSDQFLSALNVSAVLADNSGWVIINSPGVNDLSALTGNGAPATVGAACTNAGGSFPYTNNNGVTVTAANVGQVVASNVIAVSERMLAAGKKVILVEEPGSTGLNTAALVAQVYDLNARLEAYASGRPGAVYIFNYNQIVWNPVGSTTAITMKANYFVDGTHQGPLGADQVGIAFNTAFQNLFPVSDLAVASETYINGSNPLALVNNPLFTTLTGGTTSGCASVTGNVPSGWALNCHNANTSVVITSASDANGYGNDITLAVTFGAAESGLDFQSNSVSNGLWTTADYFTGGLDMSVANGSSHGYCYSATQAVTSGGNSQQFGMYPNATASSLWPTYAYSYRLKNTLKQPLSGTQSFLLPISLVCTSDQAGSITVTVSRAWGGKQYLWAGGTVLNGGSLVGP